MKTSIAFFLGSVITLSYIAINGPTNFGLLAYKPYKDVNVLSLERAEESVYLDASFIKLSGCRFNRLRVVGFSGGYTEFLEWKDRAPPPVSKDNSNEGSTDRAAGRQTLQIVISAEENKYDALVVRTRHLCGPKDKAEDRDFVTIKPVP